MNNSSQQQQMVLPFQIQNLRHYKMRFVYLMQHFRTGQVAGLVKSEKATRRWPSRDPLVVALPLERLAGEGRATELFC